MKLNRNIQSTKQCGCVEQTFQGYLILNRGTEIQDGRRMAADQLTWHIEFKSLSKTFDMRNRGTFKPDFSMTAINSNGAWSVGRTRHFSGATSDRDGDVELSLNIVVQ